MDLLRQLLSSDRGVGCISYDLKLRILLIFFDKSRRILLLLFFLRRKVFACYGTISQDRGGGRTALICQILHAPRPAPSTPLPRGRGGISCCRPIPLSSLRATPCSFGTGVTFEGLCVPPRRRGGGEVPCRAFSTTPRVWGWFVQSYTPRRQRCWGQKMTKPPPPRGSTTGRRPIVQGTPLPPGW